MIMQGTIVNTLAVLIGSAIGILVKQGMPERYEKTVMNGVGLAVGLIGLQMALKTQNIVILIISLVIGGILGEWLNIDEQINNFGSAINKRFGKQKENIGEGFVTATLMFCVGAMAIVGPIQDGLNHDPSMLYAKAILDGISAIVFAASLGIGVALSSVSIFIYQGGLTLLASFLGSFMNEKIIAEMTAVGGLLIIGLSLFMLEIKKIKVANLLPALPIVVVIAYFVR